MVTNPVQPPVPATPTPEHYDEHTGVYGFFRRHQKKLLYTAGMFTLLTFSITGSMTTLVGDWFATSRPMPSILVNGARVDLEPDDYRFGELLDRNLQMLPPGVLPPVSPGEENRSGLSQVFAVLRRAAITEGLEPSYTEVDAAIESLRESQNAESAAKVARDRRFASLAQYREVVAEAMRVGNYVRLQTLALPSSDAKVLATLLKDREKIQFKVATFDEKKAEADLKTQSPLTEEALKTWLAGKSEREKRTMNAYDLPRAELRFGALLLAEGQFDPAQWQDTSLKDFTVSDAELQNNYNLEKEARFKLPDGQYKPADDAAVKAELTRLIQAEKVMKDLLSSLRQKQTEALKSQSEEVSRTAGELGAAEAALAQAKKKLDELKAELERKQKALVEKPGDTELTDAIAKLEKDVKAAADEHFQAEDKVPALKTAREAADRALADARATFDFPAAFTELTAGKSGIVQKALTGLRNADEMKDLDALGTELGTWARPTDGTSLRSKGDLCFQPGRTTKAVLLYQATDTQPLPEKPWDTLKPLAEGAYYTEQAKKLGEEKKKAMEDALLELVKAGPLKDKVAELEGQRQKRIDDKVAEWEKATQQGVATAESTLAGLKPDTQAYTAWQQELDNKKAELAQKDGRRLGFEAEVKNAIDAEIATEAKKLHHLVLDEAAAKAGFTVQHPVGPFPRDLQQRPRFDKDNDTATVFLWRGHSKLKLNESTGLVLDPTNRAYHVAVCTKVEPLVPADLTRREFESVRGNGGSFTFATLQAAIAYQQAFTVEAIEKRYELQREVGEVEAASR